MNKPLPVISGVILLVALVLTSCGGSSTTSDTEDIDVIVPATMQALTASEPTPEVTADVAQDAPAPEETQATPEVTLVSPVSLAPNVEFESISFYLDYQLANSWAYEITSPPEIASDNPFQRPSLYQVDFQEFRVGEEDDYRGWRKPRLYIIPIKNMQSFPDGGYRLEALAMLQQILASRPASVAEPMPVVPHDIDFNNGEVYHGKLKYINFQNGTGVRFLAEYSQIPFPIGTALAYIFQGITSDGQYYISLTLPIEESALNEYNAPYKGNLEQTEWETFAENFPAYKEGAAAILEAELDSAFIPDFSTLDELIQSLTVKP